MEAREGHATKNILEPHDIAARAHPRAEDVPSAGLCPRIFGPACAASQGDGRHFKVARLGGRSSMI